MNNLNIEITLKSRVFVRNTCKLNKVLTECRQIHVFVVYIL